MSKLVWDQTGNRQYETGAKKGVYYPLSDAGAYEGGVAWNGLTGVTESPSGAESTALYADDIKYLDLTSAEDFGGTITAYTYPTEFGESDGSAEPVEGVVIGQQARRTFGMSYVSVIGNDVRGNDYGYKLHLIYGMKVSPSERSYTTINDSPEAMEFSWEFTTTPIAVTGFKPTACLTINSTKVDAAKLKQLEDMLYGTDEAEPKLPMPDEVINMLKTA